jgi:hypothetical protein
MKQYLKIPLLIILANTCAFSQESEGGANLDKTAQVRISKVTFSNGTKVQNDDGSEMGLIPGTTRPSDADTPILPQMIDEVDNDTNENFPDGFPDKTNQLKPNHVKSYAYSYEYIAPTIEGIFKWKGAPPAGQCTAWAEVIDTDNCNLPPKPLEGNVRYPTTTSAEKIVIQRKIQAYLTSNRRVERKGKAAVGAVADDMSAKCKPLKIRWTVKTPDGKEHWSDSLHTIYVTWAAPTTTLRQETLFNLSCVMANGEVVNEADAGKSVFDKIWAEYEDLVVKDMGGKALQYYAWAKILVDCARVQSVTTCKISKITSKTAQENICIAKWNFANSSLQDAYPHLNIVVGGENGFVKENSYDWLVKPPLPNATYTSGTPAQSNVTPAALFNNHKVVQFGTEEKFYDPSYGLIHNKLDDFELIIDAFFKAGPYQFTPGVVSWILTFRKNPAGLDIQINPFTY